MSKISKQSKDNLEKNKLSESPSPNRNFPINPHNQLLISAGKVSTIKVTQMNYMDELNKSKISPTRTLTNFGVINGISPMKTIINFNEH